MFNATTDAERLMEWDSRAAILLREAQKKYKNLYLEAGTESFEPIPLDKGLRRG